MGLEKIWVFGETNGDAVASITLEMLAAARDLADTVEVFMAGDGDDHAAELGEHGADTVYSTGDLDGGLQGIAVASAVAAAVVDGDVDAPDASSSAPRRMAATWPGACRSSSTPR